MGYEIVPVYEQLPAVVNDVSTSLATVNSSFDDMYSDMSRVNDMSDIMFNGIMNINFGGIHNSYQDIIDEQDEANKKVDEGAEAVGKIYSGVKKVAKAFIESKAVAKGFSSAINYSENLMNMQNSISSMNDGSQSDTVLQEKVYGASMRSRTDMESTIATVEGLSGAGFTNDEAIQYTENLNKMFVVAGTSDEVQAAATSALVGSLSDGVVSGEELNSLLSTTPEIVTDMAENMGLSTEQMTSMAEQGQLSADIMKNSMLGATGSINAEFANTKANWSDTMTNIGNMATVAFEPVGNKINEIINSPSFGVFMSNLADGMTTVANVLAGVLDIISTVGGLMADNWSIVQPILITILLILGFIYAATVGVAKAKQIAEIATKAWGAASKAFSLIWETCPIVIVILAIIAILYIVIGVINKVCGTSYSATGIIAGAIMTAVAVIWNLFLALADFILGIIAYIVNPWISFANFFANLFNDPVASVIYLFRDLAVNVLNVIKTIASAIDKIFGSNLAGTVDGWIGNVNNLADKAAEKFGNGKYEQKIERFDITTESLGLKRMDYGDSFNTGYEFGEGLTDFSMPDIGGGLGGGLSSSFGSGLDSSFGGLSDNSFGGTSIGGLGTEDYSGLWDGTGVNESTMNNISTSTTNMGSNTYNTAENTFSTTNNSSELVTISKSILEIMQTNMEKENSKPAAQNITVDLSGMNNRFASAEDGETFVNYLTNELIRKMNSSASGAYV